MTGWADEMPETDPLDAVLKVWVEEWTGSTPDRVEITMENGSSWAYSSYTGGTDPPEVSVTWFFDGEPSGSHVDWGTDFTGLMASLIETARRMK